MEGIRSRCTMRTLLGFLVLFLLQTPTWARICSVPSDSGVEFYENNEPNAVVTPITIQDGVTLEFEPPPSNPDNPFTLNGNQLVAARVLDYEAKQSYIVKIMCIQGSLKEPLTVIVLVRNKNDVAPVFPTFPNPVYCNEMSDTGTLVGDFPASDSDNPELTYRLVSDPDEFALRSPNSAEVITRTVLDFDKLKSARLVLYAEDAPLAAGDPTHTATTTIHIAIRDVDNRPPWFLPCVKREAGMNVICQNYGYTGNVVLNEQQVGVLPLKPEPLYAIDGDSGINERITYSFLSGNEDGLFDIDQNTGNITMLRAADVVDTIHLTVLAAQMPNSQQFSTTTVTISVQVKSLHEPRFPKRRYEGYITALGTMMKDMENPDQLLRLIALDEDYAAAGGENPHITYSIIGSPGFSIFDGFVFMTEDLPEGPLSLQVKAVDTTNDQSDTVQLSVEVGRGPTTTVLPLSTSDMMTTTPVEEVTTNSKTTEDIVSTEGSYFTTYPTSTEEEGTSTAPTTQPHQEVIANGVYGPEEMAAVGATLGGLLLICLVVIGVLAHRLKRGKADWRKIYDASLFRSSLGKDSRKEGIQYTNEAFQDDEDGGSVGSGGPQEGSSGTVGEAQKDAAGPARSEAILKSSAPLHALLDDVSQTSSDKADADKEVKPILTKERRLEEGYKAVWFKEDIDPNAKEEVVIIPDTREHDSEGEEEEDDDEGSVGSQEEKDDDTPKKTPKVGFADTDTDARPSVKIEDPSEDSDGYDMLTSDL